MFHFQEVVSECFSYNNKIWTQIQSLTVPRGSAAFTSVPQLMATSKNDIMVIGGRNAAGLGWTTYKSATRPPEKHPPYPAVDGPGANSGRELFDPRDQPSAV